MNQLLASKKFHERLAEEYGSQLNGLGSTAEQRAALSQPEVTALLLEALSQRREFTADGSKLSTFVVCGLTNGPDGINELPPALREALDKFDERFPPLSP